MSRSYQLDKYCPAIQRNVSGTANGQFRFISGAKFDATGEVLIADASSRRLQVSL